MKNWHDLECLKCCLASGVIFEKKHAMQHGFSSGLQFNDASLVTWCVQMFVLPMAVSSSDDSTTNIRLYLRPQNHVNSKKSSMTLLALDDSTNHIRFDLRPKDHMIMKKPSHGFSCIRRFSHQLTNSPHSREAHDFEKSQ